MSVLLAVTFLSLASFAEKLSPQVVAARRNMVAQDYRILNSVIPVARKSPKLNEWLEHLHFSRGLFGQLADEINIRATQPVSDEKVEYHLPSSMQPQCRSSVELGVSVSTAAYTHPRDPLVHLCDLYFSNPDGNSRAETLLHEQIHVAGLLNECDTEAVAFITFFAAGREVKPSYLQRCAVFKEFFEELLAQKKKNQ